jgi:hypothetical protein
MSQPLGLEKDNRLNGGILTHNETCCELRVARYAPMAQVQGTRFKVCVERFRVKKSNRFGLIKAV